MGRRLYYQDSYGRVQMLTARLYGQQVMINGNALYPPSPSRLRLLPARKPPNTLSKSVDVRSR